MTAGLPALSVWLAGQGVTNAAQAAAAETPHPPGRGTGRVTDHHRLRLRQLMDYLAHLEGLITRLGSRIETAMAPFAAAGWLATVPGVDRRTAETGIAEVGPDMGQFPTAGHLTSWAEMCPGNNESAGKRRSGPTTSRSRWLRQVLRQAVWAASHTKHTSLEGYYRRLAAWRGKERALVASGHSLLVNIDQLLRGGTT